MLLVATAYNEWTSHKRKWAFPVFYGSDLLSLSEKSNKTARIAIIIAATTDNAGIKKLDWLVTEAGSSVAGVAAGIGIVVGAGVAGDAFDDAVEGSGAWFGVAWGTAGDCEAGADCGK
jgi:hypothetical protein